MDTLTLCHDSYFFRAMLSDRGVVYTGCQGHSTYSRQDRVYFSIFGHIWTNLYDPNLAGHIVSVL